MENILYIYNGFHITAVTPILNYYDIDEEGTPCSFIDEGEITHVDCYRAEGGFGIDSDEAIDGIVLYGKTLASVKAQIDCARLGKGAKLPPCLTVGALLAQLHELDPDLKITTWLDGDRNFASGEIDTSLLDDGIVEINIISPTAKEAL